MSNEPNKLDQRWNAIAAELGLEPSSEPAPPPAEAAATETERYPEPEERFEEPVADQAADVVPSPPLAREHLHKREDVRVETPGETMETEFESPGSSHAEAAEPVPAPGEQRRERHPERGRGHRRGRPGRLAEPTESAAGGPGEGSAEEGGDSELAHSPRRRRGRSRHRKPDRDDAATTPEEKVEEPPAAESASPPAAEEDEDIDDLSSWTVPSWNELIASLYRPDR